MKTGQKLYINSLLTTITIKGMILKTCQRFRLAIKKRERQAKIHARSGIADTKREQYNSTIARRVERSSAYLNSAIIMSYMAFKGETDLQELHQKAELHGKKLVYPYCISDTEIVALYPTDEDSWMTGRFGILEPILEKSIVVSPEDIDLVICPCTVFDKQCNRMGMGAGYYDRYLPLCRRAKIIAVAFEVQKVRRVFTEPWDRAMDMVFTETRCYQKLR